MSTLWTPDGEHRVPRPGDPASSQPAGGSPPAGGQPPGGSGGPPPFREPPAGEQGELSEEEAAAAEEMAEIATALLAAPIEDVIANHCYGLFELAVLHLSQRPANLAAARAAVDAMGALVETLGPRLGQHEPTLVEGLAQLRVTWVKISDAQTGTSNGEEGTASS